MQPRWLDDSVCDCPAEVFLDFDPVFPDWPPEPVAAPPRAGERACGRARGGPPRFAIEKDLGPPEAARDLHR